MPLQRWMELLLNVDADVSSGSFLSGWDATVARRMSRVKFVQTVLLTANHRAGVAQDKGFLWTGGSFLPIFDACDDGAGLRCCHLPRDA